jgi:hypothetical protein
MDERRRTEMNDADIRMVLRLVIDECAQVYILFEFNLASRNEIRVVRSITTTR